MNALPGETGLPPADPEANTLARELATAFRAMVASYQEEFQRTAPEGLAQAQQPCSPRYQEAVLNGPADEVSWLGLEHLARQDPERAARRWEEIKRQAHDELRSGHRAAKAAEGFYSDPWQRAQFLAIRDELAVEWRPQTGIERQLIDTLAMAQTGVLFWQSRLTEFLSLNRGTEEVNKKQEGWLPPRVPDSQAMDQAGAMVDRFNRIFLRSLRALRDLRRYAPAVLVQNAGQVNVGAQQVNVAG
jgi:hypothetical protein